MYTVIAVFNSLSVQGHHDTLQIVLPPTDKSLVETGGNFSANCTYLTAEYHRGHLQSTPLGKLGTDASA